MPLEIVLSIISILQATSKFRLRSRSPAENQRDKNARGDEKAEHTWEYVSIYEEAHNTVIGR